MGYIYFTLVYFVNNGEMSEPLPQLWVWAHAQPVVEISRILKAIKFWGMEMIKSDPRVTLFPNSFMVTTVLTNISTWIVKNDSFQHCLSYCIEIKKRKIEHKEPGLLPGVLLVL